MRFSIAGAVRGRPSAVPFSLARASPALTLSRMMPRSNSANTPSIWNIARTDGLRGESSIAELCRREGIAEGLYYAWSKEFLEADKRRLAGDTARAAA